MGYQTRTTCRCRRRPDVCTGAVIVWCCLVVFLSYLSQGDAYPRDRRRGGFIGDDVMNYLMRFGYLPQSDMETGNLRTEDQLRDAIKTLQVFAGVDVTGDIDKATRALMKRPRCGLPDIAADHYRSKRNKRYTLQGQRWHRTNLTWSLRKSTTKSLLSSSEVRRELDKALNVWAKHSHLQFREVDSDDADIRVVFDRHYHGDGYPFDGPGQILAHAFFPGSGHGGDAHFDDDEQWVITHNSELGGTNLFAVAAHEFGHSLGLAHSSKDGALMNPWYQTFSDDFTLPDDDRYAIQQLYGAKGGHGMVPLPPFKPNPPKPTTPPKKPVTPPGRRPTIAPRPPPRETDKPVTCDTSYDAISVIRGEVFIFKGRYFWRIGKDGLKANYPVATDRFWYGLPKNTTHIDAVYERQDMKIVFFVGKQYYVFDGNTLVHGYPRYLTSLGLPADIDHIDGAMVWGHNRKTYLYSGTMYWRLDENERAELDYPRDMSMWRGVPYNIDAVFQWTDGKTYFFKGKSFWRFNDMRMRVEKNVPSLSAPFWMGCPTRIEDQSDSDLQTSGARPSFQLKQLPWTYVFVFSIMWSWTKVSW